jgi:hypothetical protein
MGNRIFGTPKKQEPLPVKDSPTLQQQISNLEKRKVYLTKCIDFNDQKAKESKTNEEKLRYLKLKVMYANELNTIFGMLEKLEGLDNARQRLVFQKDMLTVTQLATNAIKQTAVDPMNAEEIIDEANEAIEQVNEVNTILSRTEPISDDVQAEFDSLVSPQEPPVAPAIISFPQVPTRVEETTVDKELRMLVAS